MPTDAAPDPARRRIVVAALALATIGVGLAVHGLFDGTIGDIAGDALYAVLVYLLAALLLPRARRRWPALIAVAVCTGVELLQLTGLPHAWASAFPPIGLVLGSGFDPRDLVVYAVAAVAASVVDTALSAATRRR